MKGKKILSAAVSCAMLFGAVSVTAFADEAAADVEIVAPADEETVDDGAYVGSETETDAEAAAETEADAVEEAATITDEQQTEAPAAVQNPAPTSEEAVTLAADPVTDEESLKAAIESGGEVVLGSNITLSAGIEIPSGTTVTIDLVGYALTGANDTYVIRAQSGSVLNVKNGVISVGEWRSNWSWGVDNRGGNVTIEDVTFKGSYSGDAVTANSEAGQSTNGTTTLIDVEIDSNFDNAACAYNDANNKLIVKSGTYNSDIRAENGSVTIEDGTVSLVKIIEGGTVDISAGTIKGVQVNSGANQPNITGGDFTQMKYISNWEIPAGSNLNVGLDGATRVWGFKIYDGSFGGTLNATTADMTIGANVVIDDDFVDYINSRLAAGRRLVLNRETGEYVTETCNRVSVIAVSENDAIGKVRVAKGLEAGTAYFVRQQSIQISEGTYATFSARIDDVDYLFDGWYDSENNKISSENPATILVNENVTYTAKFVKSAEVVEFQNAAKAWTYENVDSATLKDSYTVSTKEEMSYLAYAVNSLGVDFSGKTVTLTANLKYTDAEEYTPIGDSNTAFAGTFDGGNMTISGIRLVNYIRYAGIFGNSSGTIKNLNAADCYIQGSNSTSSGMVGIIAGEGRTIENCTVTNSTVGGGFAGLIVGHSNALNVKDVTVDNCTINQTWKSGGVVGYVAGNCDIEDAEVSNITLNYEPGYEWGAGSLVGHLNSETSNLTGIKVSAEDYPLIGTAYSGSNKTVNFNGEDNDINSSVLINDLRDSVGSIKIENGVYTLADIVNEEDFEESENIFSISGGTFNMSEDVYYKYLDEGYYTIPLEGGGGYQVVTGETLIAELVQSADDPAAYDIVINAADERTINRLTAAQFAFEFDTQDAIAWEIEGAENISVSSETIEGKTVYLFNFKGDVAGDTDAPDSGVEQSQVTLGTVKFTGVGTGTFGVDSEYAGHAVHATKSVDNIVDTYIPNGGTNMGKLILPDPIELDLQPETSKLTVNVTFPNAIEDNPVEYQNMRAEITGGTLTEPLVFEFGNDSEDGVSLENQTYTFATDLVKERRYTVTITGDGYRTARYMVVMNADEKTLSFWNNVMDSPIAIEQNNDESSATVTYLAGDIVMDNKIDIYDLSAVVAYFGTIDLNDTENAPADAEKYIKYDLNRDGKIDSKDVAMVLVSWGK